MTDDREHTDAPAYRRLHVLGQVAAGLALGGLLALALLELSAELGNLAAFRYQGF